MRGITKSLAISILALLLLPAVVAAEQCEGIISLKLAGMDEEGEGVTALLWIPETLLAPGYTCEGVAPRILRSARCAPGWNGECLRLPEMTSFADGTPETFFLKPSLLQTISRSRVVVAGTIESLTPGYGESMAAGHVVTRVQTTVTESFREARGLGGVGTQLVFLQFGGELRAGSATRCTELPPYVHAWKPGDRALVAAVPVDSTEPTYVHVLDSAYRIDEDGQVTAPPNSPLVAGSTTVDEIREAVRRSAHETE